MQRVRQAHAFSHTHMETMGEVTRKTGVMLPQTKGPQKGTECKKSKKQAVGLPPAAESS